VQYVMLIGTRKSGKLITAAALIKQTPKHPQVSFRHARAYLRQYHVSKHRHREKKKETNPYACSCWRDLLMSAQQPTVTAAAHPLSTYLALAYINRWSPGCSGPRKIYAVRLPLLPAKHARPASKPKHL
jgi:hypothetical protein